MKLVPHIGVVYGLFVCLYVRMSVMDCCLGMSEVTARDKLGGGGV